jgi:hydrogenase nickel incorporation protein HypB
MNIVTVERKILERNEDMARANREMFDSKGVFVLDLLSSPGSGKTTLLEKTLDILKDRIRMAVIEGDVQTDHDARRIAMHHVPVVQIITRGGCHLDSALIRDAVQNLPLDSIQLLFIENVGNLVCPAEFDLGEHEKVVMLSTAEGDDKPLKYPLAFHSAATCVLNKTDLLPYVDFNVEQFRINALKINPGLKLVECSASTGDGIASWTDWLIQKIKKG